MQQKRFVIGLGLLLSLTAAVVGCGGSNSSSNINNDSNNVNVNSQNANGLVISELLPGKNDLGSFSQKPNLLLTAACMNGVEDYGTPTAYKVSLKINTTGNAASLKQVDLAQTNFVETPQGKFDLRFRAHEEKMLKSGFSYKLKATNNKFKAAPPVAVGDISDFKVYKDLTADKPVDVKATCKIVGEKCYLFFENDLKDAEGKPVVVNENYFKILADYFDQVAYDKVTEVFGKTVDTDDDEKLYILMAALPKVVGGGYVAGYFNSEDKEPGDNSNNHDIFLITVPETDYMVEVLKGTLAHEFQHMVNFDVHAAKNISGYSEATWLNESLSEMADFICTGKKDARPKEISDYLANPISLTLWAGDLKNYAAARLFSMYLHDRFYLKGKTNIFKDLVNNVVPGTKNVENVTGIGFNTLFKDWTATLYLSNTGWTTDPRYNYTSITIRKPEIDLTNKIKLNGLQPNELQMGLNYNIVCYPYQPIIFRAVQANQNSTIEYSHSTDYSTAGGTVIAFDNNI